MQILIDIPEELYKANHRGLEAEELWDLRIAIKNGTALPENHGRIVDLDTVTVEEDNDEGVLWLDAPTILEASYGK